MGPRVAAMALVVIAAAVAFWRWTSIGNEQQSSIRRLEVENQYLKERLEGISAPPPNVEPPGPPAIEPAPSPPAAAEESSRIAHLRESLSAANGTIDQLRARIAVLERNAARAASENRRFATAEQALHVELSETARKLEDARREARAASDKLAHAEADLKRMQTLAAPTGERKPSPKAPAPRKK